MNNIKNGFSVLILIYTGIFAIAKFTGFDTNSIYMYFGVQNHLVFGLGEYYRLISYSFFHADILHLVTNMISLYYLAPIVISMTNKNFSYIIYGISIVVSGLLVALFSQSIAIGASGAIFGLFGIIIYGALKHLRYGYTDMIKQLLPIIVINVFISFLPGISMLGHLGGLLTGIIGTYIYEKFIKHN